MLMHKKTCLIPIFPQTVKMLMKFYRCDISSSSAFFAEVIIIFRDRSTRGGSICNENPFITPFTNMLGFWAICQMKDQSVTVIMMCKKLFYLSKFNKLQAF